MARVRLIHVGLGQDEDLAKAGLDAMLVAGLLPTIADREGRLKDIPFTIHGQLLPHNTDVDMNDILDRLSTAKFIQRYEVNGKRYIQIVKWVQFQKPHNKEIKSVIPANVEVVPNPALGSAQPCLDPALGSAEPLISISSSSSISSISSMEPPPFQSVDNSNGRTTALEVFNAWIAIQENQDAVATLAKFHTEKLVRGEMPSIRAWLTANDMKAFRSWEKCSTNCGYEGGILPWLQAWFKRARDRPEKVKPPPMSAAEEQTHYANHRRTGADNSGFTSIGDITKIGE